MKDSLKKQIKERLVRVYKSEEKAEAATKLIDEQLNGYETTEALETPLSEKDSILITYDYRWRETGAGGSASISE